MVKSRNIDKPNALLIHLKFLAMASLVLIVSTEGGARNELIYKGGNLMWKKAFVSVLVTLLVVSVYIQPVPGKEYPTKPIEIVSHLTPGSVAEILARLIANVSSKYLGQPVVISNKPGASGSIAVTDIIKSPPDGYKIISLASTYFVTTVNMQKLPFDPYDLIPIACFAEYKMGMAVKGDSPWKTFADLLDYAKKNPGKLRWSYASRGAPPHLSGMLIFRKAGIQAIELSYPGTPEQIAALLGGHLDAASVSYGPGITEHVKAGTIRYLIFYGDQRYRALPDVPCTFELGFPEAGKLLSFIGLYAHKDTPDEIKKILLNAFKKTFDDPEFQKGCERIGFASVFGGSEFLKEEIKKSIEIGIPLIKELGLYVGK